MKEKLKNLFAICLDAGEKGIDIHFTCSIHCNVVMIYTKDNEYSQTIFLNESEEIIDIKIAEAEAELNNLIKSKVIA